MVSSLKSSPQIQHSPLWTQPTIDTAHCGEEINQNSGSTRPSSLGFSYTGVSDHPRSKQEAQRSSHLLTTQEVRQKSRKGCGCFMEKHLYFVSYRLHWKGRTDAFQSLYDMKCKLTAWVSVSHRYLNTSDPSLPKWAFPRLCNDSSNSGINAT